MYDIQCLHKLVRLQFQVVRLKSGCVFVCAYIVSSSVKIKFLINNE